LKEILSVEWRGRITNVWNTLFVTSICFDSATMEQGWFRRHCANLDYNGKLYMQALIKVLPFLLIRVQYTVLLYIVELDYIYYYGGYRYCIHSMPHI
jgi:hypothetical protein